MTQPPLRASVFPSAAHASESGSDERRTATIELRVPNDRVKTFRETLARVGDITSEVEKVEDVTEQRADLSFRHVERHIAHGLDRRPVAEVVALADAAHRQLGRS